ncbi:MAG: hypothetical protein OSA97_13170, partial [Nevskia sp.]|nr:hypothetical protein [Nevskia sp.]
GILNWPKNGLDATWLLRAAFELLTVGSSVLRAQHLGGRHNCTGGWQLTIPGLSNKTDNLFDAAGDCINFFVFLQKPLKHLPFKWRSVCSERFSGASSCILVLLVELLQFGTSFRANKFVHIAIFTLTTQAIDQQKLSSSVLR